MTITDDQLAEAIGIAIAEAHRETDAKIAALEAKIAQMEARFQLEARIARLELKIDT